MLIRKQSVFAAVALVMSVGFAAASAPAQTVDPGLTGTTQFDGWDSLNASATGGVTGSYPGTFEWSAPIGSSATGSGDAELTREPTGGSPGPYSATTGLYFAGEGAVYVSDATPVANLETIVFQVQIVEAAGVDLVDDLLPTLSYNGGTQSMTADFSGLIAQFQNGTFNPPDDGSDEEVPLFVNTYMVQWDLTGIVDPITDFVIDWSQYQHTVTYSLRLDQSDTFTGSVVPATGVPTPSALGMGAVGLVALMRRRGQRRDCSR